MALLLIPFATMCRTEVSATATEMRVSLHASSPRLVIPREDWVVVNQAQNSSRTAALLSSQQRGATMIVYIYGDPACGSANDCFAGALKTPSYKAAQDLQIAEILPFNVAQYWLANPKGAPINQDNVFASTVVNGQWFVITLSAASREKPEWTRLLEILKTISIFQ
jgi:hypothetical protein